VNDDRNEPEVWVLSQRVRKMTQLPLLLLPFIAAVHAAIEADRVLSLPGYGAELPFKIYSGYLETPLPQRSGAGNASTHYVLVLADDADSGPVIAWQQGGPGSSSLLGLFTELGPFTLNDASFTTADYNRTGVPTVFDNIFSWSRLAGGGAGAPSMLFLEHPAPTGFSFCGMHGTDCEHDDSTQAELSYSVFVAFFKAYPELSARPFYMTGESYAGVLVPTLALRILAERNATNARTAPWSLAGFALGNDCPGNAVYTCTPYSGWRGTQTSLEFLFRHGMLPEGKKKQIDAACKDWYVEAPPGPTTDPPAACAALLEDKVRPAKSIAGDTYEMGGGYFLYDSCGKDLLALDQSTGRPDPHATPKVPEYPNTAGEYACGQENAAGHWLNHPQVQRALHVRLVGKESFSFASGLQYNFTAKSLLAEYRDTLSKHYRILQYSGDADPCVPYVGTERWIESLGLPVTSPWRPWTAPGTMAVTGYVTEYNVTRGASPPVRAGLTFATVRDSGHMVPRYKPAQTQYMIGRWLNGEVL
jgi:serine carboxypeptidase-like clade 1